VHDRPHAAPPLEPLLLLEALLPEPLLAEPPLLELLPRPPLELLLLPPPPELLPPAGIPELLPKPEPPLEEPPSDKSAPGGLALPPQPTKSPQKKTADAQTTAERSFHPNRAVSIQTSSDKIKIGSHALAPASVVGVAPLLFAARVRDLHGWVEEKSAGILPSPPELAIGMCRHCR
jgi:hypothetical protein